MIFDRNGFLITNDPEEVKDLNKYAASKGIVASVFLVSKDGESKYILYNMHGTQEFVSQSAEAVAVHIDIMAKVKEFEV